MSNALRTLVLAACVAAFALSGCKKDKPADPAAGGGKAAPAAAEAAKVELPPMLENVPADTPYFFGALKPVPKDVIERMQKQLAPAVEMMQEAVGTVAAEGLPDTESKVGRAVIDEVKAALDGGGIEKIGLSGEMRMACYGLGIVPVCRVELKDPKAFAAFIGRVETKSGQKLPVARAGDQEYWEAVDGKMMAVAAVVGDQAVASALPTSLKEKLLPLIFGSKKPAKAMASTTKLQDLLKQHGWMPYGVGFVDVTALVSGALGDGAGLLKETFATVQTEMPPLSAECKTEGKAMAARAPSIAFGMKELTNTKIVTQTLVSLDKGLAGELAALVAAVPGLTGTVQGPVPLVFGVGLDVGKAIAYAKKKAGDITAAPYKCEHLKDLNTGAAQGAAQLSQPLPPMVTGLKGVFATVESGSLQIGGAADPSDIKGRVVIATDQAAGLVAMAQGMMPALKDFKLKNDGTPSALPEGIVPGGVVKAPQVAMTAGALGVAVGDGQAQKLSAAVKAKPGKDGPLLLFSYDASILAEQMRKEQANLTGPEAEAAKKLTDAMDRVGQTTYAVRITPAGVLMENTVVLKK